MNKQEKLDVLNALKEQASGLYSQTQYLLMQEDLDIVLLLDAASRVCSELDDLILEVETSTEEN